MTDWNQRMSYFFFFRMYDGEIFRNNANLTQTEDFSESNTPTPEQIRRHLTIQSFNGSDISEELMERQPESNGHLLAQSAHNG